MVNSISTVDAESASACSIDDFRPADADGVAELYRHVYGENYPVRDVYEPQKLIQQSLTGEAHRVVARTGPGEIIGHIAFYRSSPPNRNMYEFGQMMIRRDYRVGDMASRLFSYSLTETVNRHKLEQVWGEAVCNHMITQQFAADSGFSPGALEVGLMPPETFSSAFAQPTGSPGRVSALAMFRAFRIKSQRLYLPQRYEEALRFIYGPFDFGHSFRTSDRDLPENVITSGQISLFAAANVLRIALPAVGRDLAGYIEKAQQQATDAGVIAIQVFFPLTLPWAGAAAELLHRQGYFFGGALPRWFDDDGLLMQKLLIEPEFDGIQLFRKQARQILNYIKQDWASRNGR